MSPIPLNKSNMSSFEQLKNCNDLVKVLASRSQVCEWCRKRDFVDHLHFILDEDCLVDPTEGKPELLDLRCSYCQASQVVKLCANCTNEYYCNEACQKSHWVQHSKKCSTAKNVHNTDLEKVTNSLSNGNACNGSNSIHVSTPLAQPARRPATNQQREPETAKAGKGDLVRIAVDEVDRVQPMSSEVITVEKPAKIDLKSNDKFEFSLTFGSNPSNFYVQRNSDAEKAGFITECLNRECRKVKSWEEANRLEVGQFCAGLYDGNWYRAKLLQKTGNQYHISFIDFGNPDTVEASKLRQLPVELIDTPALAIHCKLHDLKPNENCDWSEESLLIFGDEVESGKYTDCKVYGCNKDGMYSVDLVTSNGKSMCKTIKSKLAKSKDKEKETITSPKAVQPPTPKVVQPPTPEVVEKSPQQSSEEVMQKPTKPTILKPVEKVVNKVEAMVTSPAVSVSKNPKISLSNLRKFRKVDTKMRSYVDDLEVCNKPYSAIFTNVIDKKNYKYGVMFNVDMFCDINSDLTTLCKSETSRKPCTDVEVGKIVAVEYENEWHRAYVLKVNEDGRYWCLLLDIGLVLSFDEVYALQSQFMERPSLFSLATAIGESSQEALKDMDFGLSEDLTHVVIYIIKKGDQILARVKFENSNLECNVSLKSYINAIKELTESLEDNNPLNTMPVVTLNCGSQKLLVVYHLPDDLSVFYVVPDTDGMVKIMEEVCNKQRLGKPIESPKVGTYCLAKSEDQEWYRAVITDVNEETCRVFFVDYGNEDVVASNLLLSIEPDFSPELLPAQAVKCVLNESSCNEKNFKVIAAAEGKFLDMEVISKEKNHYIVAI